MCHIYCTKSMPVLLSSTLWFELSKVTTGHFTSHFQGLLKIFQRQRKQKQRESHHPLSWSLIPLVPALETAFFQQQPDVSYQVTWRVEGMCGWVKTGAGEQVNAQNRGGTMFPLDTGAPNCSGAGLRGSKIVGVLQRLYAPLEVWFDLLEK